MTTVSKDNNTSTGQGQLGNLKTLRSGTYSYAVKLQEGIRTAKKQVDSITKAINAKEKEFYEQEAALRRKAEEALLATEKEAELEKIVVENVKDEVKASVEESKIEVDQKKSKEKVDKEEVLDIKEDKVLPTEVKEKKEVVEKVEEKKEKVIVQAEKPTTVHPNEQQRTYTDEKGNVKIRRFLVEIPKAPKENKPAQRFDKNAPKPNYVQGQRRPPQAGQQGQQGGYQQRDYRNNNSGNKDSGYNGGYRNNNTPNKDDATPQRTYQRPQTPKPQSRFDVPGIPINQPGKQYGNKNKTPEKNDDKKAQSKKNLLMKTFDDFDDDRVTVRKARSKKQEVKFEPIIKKIDHAVINTEEVVIKDLSEKIGVSAAEIIKKLFIEGIIKTINDKIEFSYAEYVANIFGVELTLKVKETAEETMLAGVNSDDDNVPDTEKRAPIVTVMGHVDHGKTSLLDAIRRTNVTEGEAGGITQHIGAYQVTLNNELITFIDTPGHAAFTAMRARGAQVTDVAVIVVAADDGVMPQTIEAINHAKAAEVPIIVAINKMDKLNVNPDTVKTQLSEHGLLPEEWGGDCIMVPVSAKTGMGLKELLEAILTVAEVAELKANSQKKASGTIIEAKLDKGRGPVATVLIKNGTLFVGDYVVAGTATGKVRAMFDNTAKSVKKAGPSMPVEVLGFSDVPNAGDMMFTVDEKLAKQVADERKNKEKAARESVNATVSLDDLYDKISEGNMKNLNLIVKTDVQGSLEALRVSLMKISNEEVKVCPLHGGVGAITETDVMLAKASNAIIIGFNVRVDAKAKASAEKEGVDIRLYRIIYDAIDDITAAMKGMLAPKYKESIIGQATVRNVFKITGVGTVAGAYVNSGKIMRSGKVRVYRDNKIVYDGQISALKRFKDDVKEVASGFECGISVVNYNDIKEDDIFEIYIVEEIEQ